MHHRLASLIKGGRETQTVDLGKIPGGVRVYIGLGTLASLALHAEMERSERLELIDDVGLRFEARGGGEFASKGLLQPLPAGGSPQIEPRKPVILGAFAKDGEFLSSVQYGGGLVVNFDRRILEFSYGSNDKPTPYVITALAIEKRAVFPRP